MAMAKGNSEAKAEKRQDPCERRSCAEQREKEGDFEVEQEGELEKVGCVD
jgi:hypothetical protein